MNKILFYSLLILFLLSFAYPANAATIDLVRSTVDYTDNVDQSAILEFVWDTPGLSNEEVRYLIKNIPFEFDVSEANVQISSNMGTFDKAIKSSKIALKSTTALNGNLEVKIKVPMPSGCPENTYTLKLSEMVGSDSDMTSPSSIDITVQKSSTKPSTPALNDPGTTDTDGCYTVSWSSVNGATSYTLEEDTSSSFSSPTVVHSGAGTSKYVTDKSDDTYYYRVKACNAEGCSGWSNVEDIVVSHEETAPSVTVLYPNGGETIPIGTQVQVSARATDDNAVTGVTFYYSTGTNWNSIGAGTRVSGTDKDGTWDITWSTAGLSAGTSYKVKAVASEGTLTDEDQSDSAFSVTPSSIIWQGDVTLINGTTFTAMAHNSGKSYETNRITALGALDAAAEKGDFNYAISDEWYANYGSFVVDTIAYIESTEAEGWLYWVNYPNESRPDVGVNLYDVKEGDVVTYYYGDWDVTPANASKVLKIQVHVQKGNPAIFDTGTPMNPYPSIPGTHTGTITPNQDITVQKLYTYPCAGTGGHTEFARIYGNDLDESASWSGYAEDRSTLTFDSPFTLESSKTYYYVIKTGSYPQIHHTKELQTETGWLNCTKFTDANGKEYDDWIPAIKLRRE